MTDKDITLRRGTADSIFAVDNRFVGCLIGVSSLLVGLSGIIIVCMYPHADQALKSIGTGSGIFDVALVAPVIGVCMYCFLYFLKTVILNVHRFSLMIEFCDLGVRVRKGKRSVLFKHSELVHVVHNRNDEILFVLNSAIGVLTFLLLKYTFRKPDFQKLVERLKRLESYTDDMDELRKLHKAFKVNHIFSTNHLELRMRRLAQG